MTRARLAAGAVLAATTVRAGMVLGPRVLSGDRWERTNHAGGSVSLTEGPAVVAGTAVATLGGRAIGGPALGWSAVGAGALGAVDDLLGSTTSKGLAGHLRALSRGEVTTGALKVLGLPVLGVLAAAGVDRGRWGIGTVLGGGVIAGTANVINLFDLRPGRALKVTLMIGAPLAMRGDLAEGAVLGTCLAALPEDLAATRMMGDTGANALGALVGGLITTRLGLGGRATALVVLIALTLASERVSFSQVIDGTPALRRVDEWGRANR